MTIQSLLTTVLFGFIATLGFGVLFSVPRNALLLSALVGTAGATIRFVMLGFGASPELATYTASLVVGLLGYGSAFVVEGPRLIYTVPGVLTMIPGISAYEVVVYFSNGAYQDGLVSVIKVTLTTGAIAAGLTTARILTQIERPGRRGASASD
jgi:uncharacterized membrane protein YjjB (DUF3815 family)